MSDDLELSAPAELDTPAIASAAEETEVPETILDLGEDEGDGDSSDNDDGGDAPEPEYVTLERNGKQYQVPKDLEGEFLMQGDYTKKTQTVAETAKALEAREAALTQQAEASEAELNARATLKSVTKELDEYLKLTQEDWDAHENQDPLGTRKHERRMEFLKAQKADLDGVVNTASTERTEKAQQDLAKRVQETLEAATKLPGVTAETRTATIDKLINFATSEGIPEQVLKANWSPTFLALLHKAQIGAEFIAKQSAARPVAKAPIVPLSTVKAASAPAASRSLSDLANSDDMEAYAAARASGRKR